MSETNHSARFREELVGVDIFIDSYEDRDPNKMGEKLTKITEGVLKLKMITNRGVKVYPDGQPETFLTDHYRCRFISSEGNGKPISHSQITKALDIFSKEGFDFIKTENLYTFDGEIGYSLGQGE
ncbi:MAG: hypothetical protein JJT78_12025 [Leptospira sp.]|nr:hypothetical protein [Leptospira sp.]